MPTAAALPAATAPRFAGDLARYRALANELAVRRQSGADKSGRSGGARPRAEVERATPGCLAPGGNDATPSLDYPAPGARTGRAVLVIGTILIAGLVLASAATWFQIEGGDVKAAETANAQGIQPGGQPAYADRALAPTGLSDTGLSDTGLSDTGLSDTGLSDTGRSDTGRSDAPGVDELTSPLEAALIASTAQAAALDDLRLRLQQVQALSDSYAARLAEEQAHSLILEEALAERQVDPAPPVPSPVFSMAPSPAQASPREEPRQPTAETQPSAEPVQPIAEQGQPTAEPVQPIAEQPQLVAELLPPAAEQRQTAAPALPPPATVPHPATAIQPTPVLSAAMLDRLMLRASQLREQGDIAAARAVLESGADSGHGPALFQLAETYDPDTLSAWRTLGTRGDVAKARELYLKAEQAGVAEATERLKSLPH